MKDNVLPELVTRVNARKIVHAAITSGIQRAQAFVPTSPKVGLRAGFQDDVDRFVAGFQAFLFKDRLKEHAKECRALNMELNEKLQAAQWAFVEDQRREREQVFSLILYGL